jgi:hypothetical protein
MDPDNFIAEWISKNPKGCQTLAGAVLYSYFNDYSDDGDGRVLTLKKAPDSDDLNSELIDAIRCTNVIDQIEDALGDCRPRYW